MARWSARARGGARAHHLPVAAADPTGPASRALLWDAVSRWEALVRARREQFERLRSTAADPADYWRRRSRNYYEAVRGRTTPDPFVAAVIAACREAESLDARWATGAEPPPATVLDVGGGFGAAAIPVAQTGRRVTVVEPHPAMTELLGEWAEEAGVADRVRVVQEPWPLAAPGIPQHDVVACAHVLYPIAEVVPFLRALVGAARRTCLVTLRLSAAELVSPDLFAELHGEPRVPQPGFGDLCAVLAALGVPFDATTAASESTWSYRDLYDAEDVLSETLLVSDRPDARARIRAWADQTLARSGGRLVAPSRRTLAGIATIRREPGVAAPDW
jgi:2-polyprenyl-3-methyl-5-hydroxy-6-metoxy-1,4-benzoquinol methylase